LPTNIDGVWSQVVGHRPDAADGRQRHA
jgi:hypothetical protein